VPRLLEVGYAALRDRLAEWAGDLPDSTVPAIKSHSEAAAFGSPTSASAA